MQQTHPRSKSNPTFIQSVQEVILQGYATFPTQNKRPITPGESWKASVSDINVTEITYPHNEYGIVLHKDDLVIDIDPRNFPAGRKVWSEYKQAFQIDEKIERSRMVRTGSGGLHLYLKKPVGFSTKKKLPKFPGLDFLTEGNYVIGPGSVVNGNPYTLLCHGPTLLAPDEVLNSLVKPLQEHTSIQSTEFRDTHENKSRFIEFLRGQAAPAIEGQGGDIETFKVACRGRDYNLSQEACFDLMFQHYNPRCSPEWAPDELRAKVRNAYTYNTAPAGTRDPVVAFSNISAVVDPDDNAWMRDLDGKGHEYKNTMKNCFLFLKNDKNLKDAFAFNLFSYKLELVKNLPWEKKRHNSYRQVDDLEVGHICLYLAQTYNVEFPVPKIWEALAIVAGEKSYHPIRNHLDELQWDGIPRLDTWLVRYCGTVDTKYTRAVGRKTLIGAVARIYQPGCKFDFVLVLEGKQGAGKSTVCRILGGQYFGDAPIDIHNPKDSIQYVHSHWIIEFAEMVSVRKADVNKLKQFIVAQEDEARPAYARTAKRFARQSIFIGTINPDHIGYLVDDTGNRRFWPVLCGTCDTAALRRDRDQILAEAKHYYEKGEILYLEDEVAMIAEHETRERLVKDPWTVIIFDWLAAHPEVAEVSTEMIYSQVIGGSYMQMNTGHARRIAVALRQAGFSLHVRNGLNVYIRPVVLPAIGMQKMPSPFDVPQKI